MEKGLNIFYDEEADVLYFLRGKPEEDVESKEMGDDIIVRLNPATSKVVGFTILNFKKRFEKDKNNRFIPLDAEFVLSSVLEK